MGMKKWLLRPIIIRALLAIVLFWGVLFLKVLLFLMKGVLAIVSPLIVFFFKTYWFFLYNPRVKRFKPYNTNTKSKFLTNTLLKIQKTLTNLKNKSCELLWNQKKLWMKPWKFYYWCRKKNKNQKKIKSNKRLKITEIKLYYPSSIAHNKMEYNQITKYASNANSIFSIPPTNTVNRIFSSLFDCLI